MYGITAGSAVVLTVAGLVAWHFYRKSQEEAAANAALAARQARSVKPSPIELIESGVGIFERFLDRVGQG